MSRTVNKLNTREKKIKTNDIEIKDENMLFVKGVIRDNLITIPITVIFFLGIFTFYFRTIFRNAYTIAFNIETHSLYYDLAYAFVDLFGSKYEYGISYLLFGYLTKATKLILILLFMAMLIYTLCYCIINCFIQHRLKFKWVFLCNLLTFVISIAIAYWSTPTIVDATYNLIDTIDQIFYYGSVGDFQRAVQPINEFTRYMIKPMIICIVMVFILDVIFPILFRFYQRKD